MLLSLIVGSRAAVVLPTQCYHEALGIEHSVPWGPCGVVSPDSVIANVYSGFRGLIILLGLPLLLCCWRSVSR